MSAAHATPRSVRRARSVTDGVAKGGHHGTLSRIVGVLQRVPAALPFGVPAQERPDTRREPHPSTRERQTGARGFVGSSAVEDHVAVARDLLVPLGYFAGKHVDSARYLAGIGFEIQRTT